VKKTEKDLRVPGVIEMKPEIISDGGGDGNQLEEDRAGANAPKPGARKPRYVLRLYITGMTPASRRAISNIEKICREHLQGNFDLEVVNLRDKPTLARGEQIIAAPTLIKKLPAPLKRLVGDLSDTEKVLIGLDLRVKK